MVQTHATSKNEITNLRQVIIRDLNDAAIDALSADRMSKDRIVLVTPEQKIGFLNVRVSVSIPFYILANLYDDQRAVGKIIFSNRIQIPVERHAALFAVKGCAELPIAVTSTLLALAAAVTKFSNCFRF
jgi:hypothetical protein